MLRGLGEVSGDRLFAQCLARFGAMQPVCEDEAITIAPNQDGRLLSDFQYTLRDLLDGLWLERLLTKQTVPDAICCRNVRARFELNQITMCCGVLITLEIGDRRLSCYARRGARTNIARLSELLRKP